MERLSEDHKSLFDSVEAIADRANNGPREIKSGDDLDACGKLVKDAGALWKKADTARKDEKQPYLDAEREVDDFFRDALARLKRIKDAFEGVGTAYQRKVDAEKRRAAEEEAQRLRDEESARLAEAAKAAAENRAPIAEVQEALAEDAGDRAARAEEVAHASAADLTRTTTTSGITVSASSPWTFEITDYAAINLNDLRPYFKREDVEKAIRLAVKQGLRHHIGINIFQDVKARFR